MNVVKDLRNRILELERQVQQKQQSMKKKQRQYEEVISSLQQQNEKLKELLQESITQKEQSSLKEQSRINMVRSVAGRKTQQFSSVQFAELANQNTFLKNQIAQLSSTYQQQIDQLTFYFDKIKTENKKLSPMHYVGQIRLLTNWIQTSMKDFKAQRDKYDKKLMQCAEMLSLYEQRIVQLSQEVRKLHYEAQQSKQKLKIISRIRI